MNIVVIPARGGSKRIPHKNIKDFCGLPMIAHAINTAKASGCFDKIIVSTDDLEIKVIAEQYGAWVPFLRPDELANDFAGTGEVMLHAIQWLQAQSIEIDYLCCLYATTPLLQAKTLASGLEYLQDNFEFDHAFSACRFSFPIQRALIEYQGGCQPFDIESISKRSQDLVETFHDAGQFYWTRFRNGQGPSSAIFSEKSHMILLPSEWVQDIDTLDDWARAEVLYQLMQQRLAHDSLTGEQ